MSHTLRTLGLAALLAASASAFMTTNASALSSHDCSVLFKSAKAANTDGGMSYKDFRAAKCSDAAAAPAAPAPAAPAAAAAKAAAPAATTAAAVAPSGSFMKDCSAAWKGMKAANTVPAGMTFKDFVAAKCVVAGAPAAAAPAAKGAVAAAPAAPAAAAAPAKMTKAAAPTEPTAADAPIKTVDKNGKPFTPGQLAFYAREKSCGAEWRGLATKPVGMGWPQYLSACNKRLKAAGK